MGGKAPLGRAAVSLYLLAGAGICPVQGSCGGYGDWLVSHGKEKVYGSIP